MHSTKGLLLSVLLLNSGFTYCMEKEPYNQNIEIKKNYNMGTFNILSIEIRKYIMSYVFSNMDEIGIDNLIVIMNLKIIDKGFNNFLITYYKDELIKISQIWDSFFNNKNIVNQKNVDELIIINNLKAINKGLFIFFQKKYSKQLKKISKILSRYLMVHFYMPSMRMESFIKAGADTNFQDEFGYMPLIKTCKELGADRLRKVGLLIKYGAIEITF